MATFSASLEGDNDSITEQEMDAMRKRREYIVYYKPPVWVSPTPDPVSGTATEVPMVTRASIQFPPYN